MGDKEMPEWDDEDDDDSNLVKDLRKQIKEAKAARAALDTELSMLRPQVRTTSLQSVLSEIGVNPKIAALLPDSIEPNKDAVSKWLDDYGDLFNVKAPVVNEVVANTEPTDEQVVNQTAGQKTEITPEVMEQWQRIQSANSAVGATTPDIEKQQIAQLGRAVAASAGNFDSFMALLQGEKPLPE